MKNLPQCDYKEFLELAKLILGESIERKKGYTFTIQRPGADHHARWMSKSIYILKMTLLLHQLPDMHWQTKKKVEKMALFVIFVYLRSWFSAPALTSAATNDIDLYKRLQKFRTIHKKVSSTTSNLLQRHTWYLTEELISVSLFDETLPEDTRNLLAAQIGALRPGEVEVRKPSLPTLTTKSQLKDFIWDRSTLLFDLLDIPIDFLRKEDWRLQPEYAAVKSSLRNLSPINDSCERALGLATRINTHVTRDETSFQELIQVVEAHQKKYSSKTKKDLKSFY